MKIKVKTAHDYDLPHFAQSVAKNDKVGRDLEDYNGADQENDASLPAANPENTVKSHPTSPREKVYENLNFAKEVSKDPRYTFEKPVFGINRIVPVSATSTE